MKKHHFFKILNLVMFLLVILILIFFAQANSEGYVINDPDIKVMKGYQVNDLNGKIIEDYTTGSFCNEEITV
ncbi:hypothetical protein HY498_01390 [Candidatus Woesearchaeota archaeon]|nr:hypothetical protein [Candidatus Woesearchaeota archaeon]